MGPGRAWRALESAGREHWSFKGGFVLDTKFPVSSPIKCCKNIHFANKMAEKEFVYVRSHFSPGCNDNKRNRGKSSQIQPWQAPRLEAHAPATPRGYTVPGGGGVE